MFCEFLGLMVPLLDQFDISLRRLDAPLRFDPSASQPVIGRRQELRGGRSADDLVQLSDGFLDALLSKLFGAQPAHAALADIAESKDVFAQRFLRFIEARGPDYVAAPHVDEV